MPSMQAPDRPRRPIRRMQRTRESCRASAAHHLPGAVGGIVVDEDDFPGDAGERRLQPPVQHGDVVALVEGGDDDRKLRQTGGLRRVFGARSDGFIHDASVYPQPPGDAKACAGTGASDWGKRAKTGPKMPTTTNRGRAYIRRSQAIHGRPSAGALKRQRRRYKLNRNAGGRSARGPDQRAISSALPGSPGPGARARREPAVPPRRLDAGWLGGLSELPDRPVRRSRPPARSTRRSRPKYPLPTENSYPTIPRLIGN